MRNANHRVRYNIQKFSFCTEIMHTCNSLPDYVADAYSGNTLNALLDTWYILSASGSFIWLPYGIKLNRRLMAL